ncbi:MAG: hypothetical protein R3F53_22425 [Gammaproteobacteria bacterium]
MFTLDQRFLRNNTSVGVMTANNVWALDKLQPCRRYLEYRYPYRDWEDLYYNEWTWDHIPAIPRIVSTA